MLPLIPVASSTGSSPQSSSAVVCHRAAWWDPTCNIKSMRGRSACHRTHNSEIPSKSLLKILLKACNVLRFSSSYPQNKPHLRPPAHQVFGRVKDKTTSAVASFAVKCAILAMSHSPVVSSTSGILSHCQTPHLEIMAVMFQQFRICFSMWGLGSARPICDLWYQLSFAFVPLALPTMRVETQLWFMCSSHLWTMAAVAAKIPSIIITSRRYHSTSLR